MSAIHKSSKSINSPDPAILQSSDPCAPERGATPDPQCLFGGSLRRILAFCGWVTLSAVHVRRPPLSLRLLRLVPCVTLVATLLGAALLPLESPGLVYWSEAVSEHGFILHALLVLLVLYRAERLEIVVRGLEALHGRARGRRRPSRRHLLLQCSLIWLLEAAVCALWLCFVLVPGKFYHPHYLVYMYLPDALRSSPGYWFAFTFQVAVVIFTCCLAATFDVCLFICLSAVSFHLETLQRMVEETSDRPSQLSAWKLDSERRAEDDVEDESASGRSPDTSQTVLNGDLVDELLDVSSGRVTIRTARPRPDQHSADPPGFKHGSRVAPALEVMRSQPAGDALGVPADTLASAEPYYGDIRRFLADVNLLCGLPLFGSFAASLTNIVSSAYAVVLLSCNVKDDGIRTKIVSYLVYIILFAWRVIVYSVSGSDIMDKNAALTESLTKMNWSGMSKADERRGEALLQYTKLPFSVNAMGFFTVEKSNILTVFGFIMTYFIILLQMGGPSQDPTSTGAGLNVLV